MKNSKILPKDNLKSLLSQFLNDDTVDELLKHSEFETIQSIPLEKIIDNHYIAEAKIKEEDLEVSKRYLALNGSIVPLIVRKYQDKYEVIIGRVMYQAMKELKLLKVPALEINVNDEETLNLVVNDIIERKNFNSYELSLALGHLKTDFNYSSLDLRNLAKISFPQLVNLIALTNACKEVREDLASGKLKYCHARSICRLNDDDARRILKLIYENNLSVREVESLARQCKNKQHVDNLTYLRENNVDRKNLKISIYFEDLFELEMGFNEINELIKKRRMKIKK